MSISAVQVSVITGVLNGERYIRETVASILGQSHREFEYIVVDDCSSDRTPEILDELAASDERLRVIHSDTRLGIGGTKNRAIAEACGKYIALIDGDDIALPDRFEKQVAYMDEHPDCVLLGGQFDLIGECGEVLKRAEVPCDHETIVEWLFHGHGAVIAQTSAMMRLGAVEAVGGYREDVTASEDLDIYLRLVTQGTLANLPDYVLQWRRHPTSLTALACERNYQEWLALQYEILRAAAERLGRESGAIRVDENRPEGSAAEWYAAWGRRLLNKDRAALARRYARRAIMADLRCYEGWRVLIYASLGSTGGELVRRLFRRLLPRRG